MRDSEMTNCSSRAAASSVGSSSDARCLRKTVKRSGVSSSSGMRRETGRALSSWATRAEASKKSVEAPFQGSFSRRKKASTCSSRLSSREAARRTRSSMRRERVRSGSWCLGRLRKCSVSASASASSASSGAASATREEAAETTAADMALEREEKKWAKNPGENFTQLVLYSAQSQRVAHTARNLSELTPHVRRSQKSPQWRITRWDFFYFFAHKKWPARVFNAFAPSARRNCST